MSRRARGTVKSATVNVLHRAETQLRDQARRRKRPGTFVPVITIAFFAGIRLKPTATSHGSTLNVGDLLGGRLSTRDSNEHYGGRDVGGQ